VSRIIDKMPSKTRRDALPWDEWLDGQARILTKGEDFHVDIRNMQSMFTGAARSRGLKGVTAKVSDTEVAVQAVPLNGNPS
jgi:hypothetical protein